MSREADVLYLSRILELLRDWHAQLRPFQPFFVVNAVEAKQVDVAAGRLERVEGPLKSLTELRCGRLWRDLGLHDDVGSVDLLTEFAARKGIVRPDGSERWRTTR